jgi:serine/threonine protein kinase
MTHETDSRTLAESALDETLLASDRTTNESDQYYCPTCDRSFTEPRERCVVDGTLLLRLGSDRDLLIGTTLDGRFELRERIGRGGMGTVYLANQLSLQREVAVKIINPDLGPNNIKLTKRFGREARLASRLIHPNIVTTHELGQTEDGRLYLVMELLVGRPLSVVLANDAPLATERVVALGKQLTDALACAHRIGIVHRDLKPANIMVLDTSGIEQVKILDFGLAKVHAGAGDLPSMSTLTEGAVGTPRYMAPEVILGKDAVPASDLYALGLILYEALTGEPPFHAKTYSKLFMDHCEQAPPRLPVGIDERFAGIVYELLDKSPDARFGGDAAALRVALDQVLERPRVAAPLAEFRAADPPSRRPWPWQLGTVVGFGLAAALMLRPPEPTNPEPTSPEPSNPEPIRSSPPTGAAATVDDATTPVPASVEVAFATDPPGATIIVDGQALGTTPLTREWPRGDERVEVRFDLDDHRGSRAWFVPTADQRVEAALEAIRESRAGKREASKSSDVAATADDEPKTKPTLDFVEHRPN